MEEIIAPIDRELIMNELVEEVFVRNTSKGDNQLYLVNHKNAPNTVREVGRLREVAFRTAGGGTGKEVDLDRHDLGQRPYDQLVVWDPEDREITAGYRLIKCEDAERDEHGKIISATAHLFDLSDTFVNDYLPVTVELGRSFVQPQYQRGSRKGVFALDNLWDGLAAIMILNPHLEYMFGKVTMYPDFDREARNTILAFLYHYFPDPEELVRPQKPMVAEETLIEAGKPFIGLAYKEGYQELVRLVRSRGQMIPPLINSYMGLSRTMKTFGTALNEGFGNVEETGILIKFQDIDPVRKTRYIDTFESSKTYYGPRVDQGKL